MTVAGGKLIEVGNEFSGCTPREVEAAITPRTAGIHHMAHGVTGKFASKGCEIVDLETIIDIAHRNQVPVIVDAAYQCYPLETFYRYAKMEIDLVAFSCKYFGGPNTAGILLGRKDLIDTVALQSFIGQEGGPGGKVYLEATPGRFHGSVFRGYKMDRSSIIGAVTSLEEHLNRDYEKIFENAHKKIKYLKKSLKGIPDLEFTVYDIGSVADEPGRISLHITKKDWTQESGDIVKTLMEEDPPIWASANENHLVINITSFRGLMLLKDKDEEIIAEKLKKILV
jgi:L-seryl-tRNA(Ser) seleniumtransferase